jgi:hypothetical protein
VDKNADGDYLISLRHTNTILLISGKDGHVIWRLGGTKSDFELVDGLTFSRQHNPRFVSHSAERTIITFLDNASGETMMEWAEPTHDFSRGLVVEMTYHDAESAPDGAKAPGSPWTARALREFGRPDGQLAKKRGNMQVLPNGNIFMGWTDGGYLSEHEASSGRALMEARFADPADRLATYRSYKFADFVGRPTQPPDVKALGYGDGAGGVTAVYASWNGATEHRAWNFYADGELLGRANRTGFETVFVVAGERGATGRIRADALDAEGNVLGSSNEVDTEYPAGWAPVHPPARVGLEAVADDLVAFASNPYLFALLLVPGLVGCYVICRLVLDLLERRTDLSRRWTGYTRLSTSVV